MDTNTTTTTRPSVVDQLVDSLDGIDPNTPAGGVIYQLVAALVELQIELQSGQGATA